VQQFADDVEAILDQLDLNEVVLVGHSMGGKVAQIVAGRGTPTLTGLILVAPAPPVSSQHITSQLCHAYDDAESIRYAHPPAR
jgi:pimeloyl-ACP methyl ester carboxylesterase